MVTEADVVIVGAGAAGSLYTAEFAAAGRKVVVLEAGPAWDMSDLVSSQLWARRLKWGGAPTEFAGNHRGFSHNLNSGWGFGGAALHHYGTWPRMHDELFRHRSQYGTGRDWPISGAELRAFYDEVQAEAGISGDAAAEPWRPDGADYPLPPLKSFAQGAVLARGFENLGWPVAPLPVAIATDWYKDRPPCQYDGWCDAGCPTGALANPLAIWLPRAVASGAVLMAEATVTRVLPGEPGRVAGVEYADARGNRRIVRAETVVVAASAVQTPRLLLNSACPEWPAGAANGRDQVGRNFMLDALALSYGLFDTATENHLGVAAGQLTNRVRDGRDRPGAPPGSYQWQIGPAMKPNDIFGLAISRAELFGPRLATFMTDAVTGLASMVAMIGQLPDPANRIVLASGRDRSGMPLARVEHRTDEAVMALWRHCVAEGEAVMRAAGARETWTGPFNCGHLIGGTLMGDDPATSVTDSFGRCHELPNLVLAGSGLFPVSGGISPTFTLLAVALRSVRKLLET